MRAEIEGGTYQPETDPGETIVDRLRLREMTITGRTVGYATAALLAALGASRSASAQETPPAPRFGDRGQLVVTADRLLPIFGFTTQTITSMEGAATTKITDSGTSIAFLVGHEPTLGAVHTDPARRGGLQRSAGGSRSGGSFEFAFGRRGLTQPKSERQATERRPTARRARRARRSSASRRAAATCSRSGPTRLLAAPRVRVLFGADAHRADEQREQHAGVDRHRHTLLARPRSSARMATAAPRAPARGPAREHPPSRAPTRRRSRRARTRRTVPTTCRCSTSVCPPASARGSISSAEARDFHGAFGAAGQAGFADADGRGDRAADAAQDGDGADERPRGYPRRRRPGRAGKASYAVSRCADASGEISGESAP